MCLRAGSGTQKVVATSSAEAEFYAGTRASSASIGATRLTLPHIIKRTRDVDEHVRKAAFKFIAEKIHIKSLTIAQREQILQGGLSDRSAGVKNIVERELSASF